MSRKLTSKQINTIKRAALARGLTLEVELDFGFELAAPDGIEIGDTESQFVPYHYSGFDSVRDLFDQIMRDIACTRIN